MSERDEAEQTTRRTGLSGTGQRHDPRGPEGRRGNGAPGATVPPGAAPWERAATSEQPAAADDDSGFSVGAPQHGNRAARPTGRAGGRGSSGSIDAPTGYVEPVRPSDESRADSADAGTAVFGRATLGLSEQPTRENTASSRADSSAPDSSSRMPRRANLQLKGFDPWSVLRLSLVLSIAGFFVWLVAVVVLYLVLGGMGVWDQVNTTYAGLTAAQGGSDDSLVSFGSILAGATVIGLINIVLFTAFATVVAYIYNIAADMAGGIELTLSERE